MATTRRCRTGKRSFRDREQAKDALTAIRWRGEQRARTPVRAYQCPFCKRWHFTSQEEGTSTQDDLR
jgi:hypothetical protein